MSEQAIAKIEAVTADVQAAFGALTPDQLNWKPSEKSWSIAQCLEHLILINSLYFRAYEAHAKGTMKPSLWAQYSPFSGMLGRFMIRSLGPDPKNRMKTSAIATPSSSRIDGDIVERFSRHQHELIAHIRGIPESVDTARTPMLSPLLGVITYSLADSFTILAVHEQRHLQQAKRVLALLPASA